MLVLLLAIVTDYCVFFLTEMRRRLTYGEEPREAAYCTGVRIVPIVVTAGLIVAAGTGTLLLGSLGFFRALGPGMAVTALVGTLVSLTLVPALLATAGHLVFRGAIRRAKPERWRLNEAPLRPSSSRPGRAQVRTVAEHRGTAIGIAIACIAGLGALAYQARDARLGFTLIEGLPSDAPVARGGGGSGPQGFAAGIVAPTEILDRGARAVSSRMDQLVKPAGPPWSSCPAWPARSGPASRRPPTGPRGETKLPDAFVSADGGNYRPHAGGARRRSVLRAEAIDRRRRPARGHAHAAPEGDRPAGRPTRQPGGPDRPGRRDGAGEPGQRGQARRSAALLVNLFFLILFLRAIIAPIYLLFSSVLALGATYGLDLARGPGAGLG